MLHCITSVHQQHRFKAELSYKCFNEHIDTGLIVKYWCLFVGTFILQSSVSSHWSYSTVPNDRRGGKKKQKNWNKFQWHKPWRTQIQGWGQQLKGEGIQFRIFFWESWRLTFQNSFIYIFPSRTAGESLIALKENRMLQSASQWCAFNTFALATRWSQLTDMATHR